MITLINIFEYLYCSYMKNKGVVNEYVSGIDTPKKRTVKSIISSFAEGWTFLYFKMVGYFPSHQIRMFLYRRVFLMDIENNVVIYYGLETRSPWNISLGKGTIVGDHAILDARRGIVIGENVNISTGVWMWTLQHDMNSPSFSTNGKGGKIEIGNRAWISSRSTILPNCSIAEGVVVAASAVVTKSCDEPFGVYAGVPAKKITDRNSQLDYEFDGSHRYFI